MITKGFSWDGLESEGGIHSFTQLQAVTWSILGAEDDETLSEAVQQDLRYRHDLCLDALIGRRREANLNKNTLHNYERCNQAGFTERNCRSEVQKHMAVV